MKPRLAVVDYGMGNLRSVEKALQKAGANAFVTTLPSQVRKADAVVLPGVGAFGEAVKRLTRDKLMVPLVETLEKGKPFLGICLGLQLLFERSEESRGSRGIGFLRGSVIRFKPKKKTLKVPHMGWNTILKADAGDTAFLRGVKPIDHFYFVHSYYPAPEDQTCVAATTFYETSFCSVAAQGTLVASQFHPEKSGDQGQRLLRNFLGMVEKCA